MAFGVHCGSPPSTSVIGSRSTCFRRLEDELQPRQLFSDSTYLITRRCVQRQFLLLPYAMTAAIVAYVLARTATKYPAIRIHAFSFMSNHYHLVVTDRRRELPLFMRDFNRDLARALNAQLERREAVFVDGSYNEVRLEDSDAVVNAIVYVLANPVSAGLVARASRWPGYQSRAQDLRGVRRSAPAVGRFFSHRANLGERETLEIVRPASTYSKLSDEEFACHIQTRLHREERAIQESMRARGRSFPSAQSLTRGSPYDRPKKKESRGNVVPKVKTRCQELRRAAIDRLRLFYQSYRQALIEYLGGNRDVVFPAGTYLMDVQFGARCEPHTQPD